MRQLSAKVWIAGTVVLALVLLAGVWLLLIDPVMTRAAEDTAAAEQQRQQNDLLELEIVKLADDFTHLDEYKAELAALRLEMPVTGDGASISRELQALATGAGVTITSVAPSVPQVFVPAAAAAAPVADAAAADATTTDGTDTTGSAAPVAPSAVPGLYTVPITINTVGSYDGSVAFLRSVQSGASRLYLVSSITAQTQEAQGASGGRPATAAGDVELTITGYAYVLTDGSTPVVEPDTGAALPTPSGQPNPFAPVG
jgi:Tfp pilus assembly protein PilO